MLPNRVPKWAPVPVPAGIILSTISVFDFFCGCFSKDMGLSTVKSIDILLSEPLKLNLPCNKQYQPPGRVGKALSGAHGVDSKKATPKRP